MSRLITKEDREKSRAYQFQALTDQGYQRTDYKNLIVFTHPETFCLKSFWGSAANHTDFLRYRTAEQMAAKVQSLKETADVREKWAAEQKERNKGRKSNQAAASAAIKSELRQAFPDTKFSVTSEGYAGGDSVRIAWTNGPTVAQVEAFSSKYQYGSFNGMEDIYEHTNRRSDIPQSKYVSENREVSEEITKEVISQIEALNYYDADTHRCEDRPENIARQLLSFYPIPASYEKIKVSVGSTEGAHGWAGCFMVEFIGQPEKATQEPQERAEIKGKVQIVSYSDKSIVVIGETYPIRATLKEMGGRFNKFLSVGPGWVFPLSKLDELKGALTRPDAKIIPIEKAA